MAIGHFYLRVIRPLAVAGFLKDAPAIFFDKDMACEGHKVTCSKHPGHYRICGGLDSDEIHGKKSKPEHCTAVVPVPANRFIPSIDDTYEFSTGAAKADTAKSQVVRFPVLPTRFMIPKLIM